MNNKVVWITGASSGIGEALAYAYNASGAKLIISARNRDELFRVKGNCKNQINVHVLSLDLEDQYTLNDKAKDAIRIYGHIDLLINSAGIGQRSAALQTDLTVEQKIMNINFWGTVILSKAVLPAMIAHGGGKIACISSLAGKFGRKNRSSYAASKHALLGYFDSLRNEVFDQNINLSVICPGFIKTGFSANALKEDGSPYGIIDQAQQDGLTAADCAAQIITAISKNKEEVYIGGKETRAVLYKRLFPERFSKFMKKQK
jgi:dehydrogenase/reductase SDR family protein 7B